MIISVPRNLSLIVISVKADTIRWKIRKTSIFQETSPLKITYKLQKAKGRFLFDFEINTWNKIFYLKLCPDESERQDHNSNIKPWWSIKITKLKASNNVLYNELTPKQVFIKKFQLFEQKILKYLSHRCYQRLFVEESLGCGQFFGQNYLVLLEPNQIDWHSSSERWAPLEDNFFLQQQWHTVWPGSVVLYKMKHN